MDNNSPNHVIALIMKKSHLEKIVDEKVKNKAHLWA